MSRKDENLNKGVNKESLLNIQRTRVKYAGRLLSSLFRNLAAFMNTSCTI